jgi:hypothetical protein
MCGRYWLPARPFTHPTLRRTNTTPGLAVAAAELGATAAAAGSLTAALWGAHNPLGRRRRAVSAEICPRTVPSRVYTAATPS